jgi:acyl-CoA synthetase (AMP-forming)/AMP-acid ligase II
VLIGDIARLNARRFPTKPAVVLGDDVLTWSALDERANRLATYLLDRGLVKGDRVAVAARNTIEWPEICFALAKAGLVCVPVNVRLAPDEVAYVRDNSGCRAAIVHHDHADAFASELTDLDTVVEIGGSDLGSSYDEALSSGHAVHPIPEGLTERDIYFLLYTSGTTGRPKAVVNEHRGMLAQVLDTSIVTEARHNDVLLALTPFFTAGGMVRTLAWLFLGQTIVVHTKFDPEAALDEIERRRVTMTTFIPTMLLRTLQAQEARRRDVSSLRRISYGSAPSTPGLIVDAADILGCDLQQRYGLTEVGGQATILTPEDHRAIFAGKRHLLTSCGRETPLAEIRIVGEDGDELANGEVGEIVIRSDAVARGYWNRPDETAATFRPTGVWSGDLGRLDDEGYLYIAGRKTDMIISGGFNVYPAEIERVIATDPGVNLVAVVGVPHPEWGETPVAFVVPTADADASSLEERLRRLCHDELAGYKQPRRFEVRSELPLGPAGKILKGELRAGYQVR